MELRVIQSVPEAGTMLVQLPCAIIDNISHPRHRLSRYFIAALTLLTSSAFQGREPGVCTSCILLGALIQGEAEWTGREARILIGASPPHFFPQIHLECSRDSPFQDFHKVLSHDHRPKLSLLPRRIELALLSTVSTGLSIFQNKSVLWTGSLTLQLLCSDHFAFDCALLIVYSRAL